MSLDELRKRIADLDESILDLVSERMEVAREVGEIKSREEVPIRNYPVEARVMERFLEGSSRRGIEAELGSGLASLLIDQAVRLQSGYRDMSFKKGSGRVLVAGGKGKMGRWLCDFFHAQGYQVEVCDPGPGESEYPLRDDFAEAASRADLVILSVPILEIESMLQSLDPEHHDCLILDISSLKTPIKEPLRDAASRGLRVASIHPMFGPDAVHLIGLNIVFCDCGNALALAEAKQLFVDLGANLVELSLEEHDRRIGYVLGLAHL
ncbi:MAG: prephenate dehydrogenase/arogenate dehydrogenase family protein, partial [Candidatus Krumholzibacteria bacterium]|nr:prephenate dehydrogenase/arogenate dehydrogenase family protein [Candidatus Krumholzibacteria bacterium]